MPSGLQYEGMALPDARQELLSREPPAVNNNLQALAGSPTPANEAKIDWLGVETAVRAAGYDPSDAITGTWASIGTANIEALIDPNSVVFVFPRGIISTEGRKTVFGGKPKYVEIPLSMCQAFGPDDTTDDRGFGKFTIEFAGPGNILLGRIQWNWRGKRFRDNRIEIMQVAAERDRVLDVIQGLLS